LKAVEDKTKVVEDNGEMVKSTIRMNAKLLEEVKIQAIREHITLAEIAAKMAREYLARHQSESKFK
jgi:hypothetical protein